MKIIAIVINLFMIYINYSYSNYYNDNINKLKIEIIKYIPESNDIEPILSRPLHIELIRKGGGICISDQKENKIFILSEGGNLIKAFGNSGQGPGDLGKPLFFYIKDNEISIGESGNMRIQIFDLEGNYKRIIKTYKGYASWFINTDDMIYGAPFMRSSSENKLIEVLSLDGKIERSFGESIEFGKLSAMLNMINIAVNDKNEIIIAFKFMPIIRKYSLNGDLISEVKVEDKFYEKGERENLASEGNRFLTIFNIFKVYKNKYYTLRKQKNIEIIEIDENGKISKIYEFEDSENRTISDIAISDDQNGKIFYLLEVAPNARIIVMK